MPQTPSQESSEKYTGPYRKPRADLYTMLLLLALLAIGLAIFLLYLEQERFQFEFKGGPTPTTASSLAPGLPIAMRDAAPGTSDLLRGLG